MATDTLTEPLAPPCYDETITPEERRALAAQVRAVLQGREQPIPMVTPPEITADLQRELGWRKPPVSAKGWAMVESGWNMDYYYRGKPVLTLVSAYPVCVSVVAGAAAIEALDEDLTPDENRQLGLDIRD